MHPTKEDPLIYDSCYRFVTHQGEEARFLTRLSTPSSELRSFRATLAFKVKRETGDEIWRVNDFGVSSSGYRVIFNRDLSADGITLITEERDKCKNKLLFDNKYKPSVLKNAAIAVLKNYKTIWPFPQETWKNWSHRERLIIAGQLICAQLDADKYRCEETGEPLI